MSVYKSTNIVVASCLDIGELACLRPCICVEAQPPTDHSFRVNIMVDL